MHVIVSLYMCEVVYLYKYVFIYMSMFCLHRRAEACLYPSRGPGEPDICSTSPSSACGGVRGIAMGAAAMGAA